MKKQTQQYGGFTLVELMAASVTAFIAMVAVGGMIQRDQRCRCLDEVTEVMDELRVAGLLQQTSQCASRSAKCCLKALVEDAQWCCREISGDWDDQGARLQPKRVYELSICL